MHQPQQTRKRHCKYQILFMWIECIESLMETQVVPNICDTWQNHSLTHSNGSGTEFDTDDGKVKSAPLRS